jgi:hypothetical protein
MKKFSKRGALLVASIMALAAFAMPAGASAASTWASTGSIGGTSTSVVLTGTTAFGAATVTCNSAFTGNVVGGTDNGTITGITFGDATHPCVGGGIATGCTIVTTSTNVPSPGWHATSGGTTGAFTVTISGISADIAFSGASCPTALRGVTMNAAGAVTGTWTNTATDSDFVLTGATGISLTVAGTPIGTAAMDASYTVTGPQLD